MRAIYIDDVSEKLRDVLARYGEGIAAEPEMLEALLLDCCPGKRKEVRLLVASCRERLPADLRNPYLTPDATLSRHYNILVDNYGFSRELAYGAVTAWAHALGVSTTFQIKPGADTAKTALPSMGGQHTGSPCVIDEVSEKLREVLARYGVDITAEPEKLGSALMDCCPGNRREVRLLVIACRLGLPGDLRNPRANADMILSRYYNLLVDDNGFSQELSYWAVTAWACALGVPNTFEIKTIPSAGKTATTPTAGPQAVYYDHVPAQQAAGHTGGTGTIPVKQATGQPASTGQSTTTGSSTHGAIKVRTPLPVILAGFCLVAVIVLIFVALYWPAGGTPSFQSTPQPGGNTATAGQQYVLLNPGVLSIATETSYPPFESVNSTSNAIEGFDVDLMNEIGKELGLEVKYTDQAFDAIIPAVQTGKFDAAVAALLITPMRQEIIDFTVPYYESPGQGVCVRAIDTSITKPSDIVGQKIGVLRDKRGLDAVFRIGGVNEADVKTYATVGEALTALKTGEVTAVVYDYDFCERFATENSAEFRYLAEPLTETEYLGIVINKDNPGLTAAINQALTKIKADGRLQRIYDKWFV